MNDIVDPKMTQDQKDRRRKAIDLHMADKLDEALPLYQKLLGEFPNDPSLWTNLGVILRIQGHLSAAIACHRRALELDPMAKTVRRNLGNVLRDIGQHQQAVVESSVGSDANARDQGRNLQGLGHWKASISAYDEWLDAHPDDHNTRINRATARLTVGDFKGGMDDYSARWDAGLAIPPVRSAPQWRGEATEARTIAVFGEQGLGDFIFVSRILPALKARFPVVRLICRAPLIPLFQGLDCVDEVYDRDKEPPKDEDVYITSMDLIRVFDLTPTNPPPPISLTIPDDAEARAANSVQAFTDRFKIGICWAGSVTYRGAHHKVVEVGDFLQLCDIPGVQLFSLYKGPKSSELGAIGAEALIRNVGEDERHFGDTAAMIMAMDLVVTVDTSIAHLAGALGKPVWVLLSRPTFWYWGRLGEATPWYSSMRLMRQTVPGDWDSVFRAIHVDLENLIL